MPIAPMPNLNIQVPPSKPKEFEITLMVKSKSAEDKLEQRQEDHLPDLGLKRCESVGNFASRPSGPSGRPRFQNSKMKPKNAEKTINDVQDLLENMPKICPQETLKVFVDFLSKGIENVKVFVVTIMQKAVNTEKRFLSTSYAEVIHSLLDSEKDKQKDPLHWSSLLKKCLLRKIQDVYEDQQLLLFEKNGATEATDLEKSLHKLLFLDFMKALYRVGVLSGGHIRNSLILLLVIFFNDNARAEKNCPPSAMLKKNKNTCNKTENNHRKKNHEFRLHFTLELILTYLAIIFKGKINKNHDQNIERIKHEKYSFYEDFFCKGHQEQLIHNFSKDLLKIFNIFKENYDVSWLIIKEIFTVNNDYLIIMENDVQKLKIKKFRISDKICLDENEKTQCVV